MTKKLTMIMGVLAVAGLIAGVPALYAESPGEGPADEQGIQQCDLKGTGYGWGHGRKNRDPEEFFKDLNLTAEQKEKLKARREAGMQQSKAVREQLKVKMQALHEEIAKPGTTRESVNGLIGEINALKAQMFSQRIDGIFTTKQVLTPEQFTKMEEKHKKWMEKKGRGWGNRGGGQKEG